MEYQKQMPMVLFMSGDLTLQTSACFQPILLGATWNEKLIKKLFATGEEALFKDVDVLLAPTINLHRHPLEVDILNVTQKILS